MSIHPLHDQLAGIATANVRHDPMCGAHPLLDDGPCHCGPGLLARLVAAVIDEHHPVASNSVNSLNCETHHPLTGTDRAARNLVELAQACPDCEVTQIVVCSCWGCSSYPCATVEKVADALTMEAEA